MTVVSASRVRPGTARDRGIAVLAAVSAAALVWVLAHPVFGQDLVVTQPGKEPAGVGIAMVLFFAGAASLAGWGLLAALERFSSRARDIWTAIAAVVFVLSFLPLVSSAEAAGGTKASLALMHAAVAAVLIPGFWRTIRR